MPARLPIGKIFLRNFSGTQHGARKLKGLDQTRPFGALDRNKKDLHKVKVCVNYESTMSFVLSTGNESKAATAPKFQNVPFRCNSLRRSTPAGPKDRKLPSRRLDNVFAGFCSLCLSQWPGSLWRLERPMSAAKRTTFPPPPPPLPPLPPLHPPRL